MKLEETINREHHLPIWISDWKMIDKMSKEAVEFDKMILLPLSKADRSNEVVRNIEEVYNREFLRRMQQQREAIVRAWDRMNSEEPGTKQDVSRPEHPFDAIKGAVKRVAKSFLSYFVDEQ